MKVFLDTNVLISAFLGSGLCSRLLRVITERHTICVSELVMGEYKRVLQEKLGAGGADLTEAMKLVDTIHREEPGVGRFRPGAFVAAMKSDMPVIPIAIHGSRAFLPHGAFLPRRRPMIIEQKELRFPEGVACAEVLKAGDRGGEDR